MQVLVEYADQTGAAKTHDTFIMLPELDPEVKAFLTDVAVNRNYEIDSIRWKAILPKLTDRLSTIVSIAKTGDQYGTRPVGVNLPEAIEKKYKRIESHIEANFTELPPFTIPRLAEILLDPAAEGYDLVNNIQILKYFNSLARLVLVSSVILDYPPTTFTNGNDATIVEQVMTSQTAVSIPMVEIPWLKESSPRRKRDEEVDTPGKKPRTEAVTSSPSEDMAFSSGTMDEIVSPKNIDTLTENPQSSPIQDTS